MNKTGETWKICVPQISQMDTDFFYNSNDSFVALRAEIFEKIFLKIYGAYGSEMNIINSYL